MDILKYLLLSFLLLFLSCSAKRNVVADSSHVSNDTVSIVKTDTVKIYIERDIERTEDIKYNEDKYIKETDYDKDGNVTKTTETIILSNFQQQNIQLDFTRAGLLSVFNSTENKGSNSETKNHQYEITKQDSRLIQGTEWFWILIFTLVVGILMFFYFKK